MTDTLTPPYSQFNNGRTEPSESEAALPLGAASFSLGLFQAGKSSPERGYTTAHLASGSGRSWNLTTFGRFSLPPSRWNTVLVE